MNPSTPDHGSPPEPDAAPPWPYLVALGVLIAIGLGFGSMARFARLENPAGFDRESVVRAGELRSDWPAITAGFRLATRFGNPEVATPISVFLVGLLLILGERRIAGLRRLESLFWLGLVAGGWELNNLLKIWIERARPPENLRALVLETRTFSFPSNHATFAAVFFGYLAFLLARTLPKRPPIVRRLAVAACVVLALAVAASRVWLGVHYPSDVIGGLLLGAGWVGISALIRSGWARWRRRGRSSA